MTGRGSAGSKQAANVVAVIILLAAAVAYTWATWQYFTLKQPGGNDFLARYTAWEAYFEMGLNPYSDEATLHTQEAVYGRPALPGEDLQRLTYPFYSVLLHGPFILLPYPLARAVLMTLLQAAVVIGVALTLAQLGWRPPVWLLGMVVAWALLDYHQARGVILGQVAIFGFLSLAGTLYLLACGRDSWAGMLLVLSTVKPTLVFLVVPFLLLWAARQKRWHFIGGFAGLLAVLCAGSFVALPSWLGDFWQRVVQYPGYTVGQSPLWVMTHEYWPGLGAPVELLLMAVCAGWLLWAWWLAIIKRPSDRAEFQWALGVTLVVSNLVVPRSATTNYVLMLVTTLWVFQLLDRRAGRVGRSAIVAAMLAALVGMWWMHFATVQGNQEQSIMYFPWPAVMLLVLTVGRPWLLRAARQPATERAGRPLAATA